LSESTNQKAAETICDGLVRGITDVMVKRMKAVIGELDRLACAAKPEPLGADTLALPQGSTRANVYSGEPGKEKLVGVYLSVDELIGLQARAETAEAKLKEKDAWIEQLTGTKLSERMLPALQTQLAEAWAECDMLKAGYRWWDQPTLAKAREEGARAERDRIKNALFLRGWTFALDDGTTVPGYRLKDVNAVLEAKP
jgi:hypothetical protein